MVGLRNVWICAQDLQLIRADRIVSLLVPIATSYGAASPHDPDLQTAVCAEVEGGTGGESLTRVQLGDCGKTPAAELLTGLASALGSEGQASYAQLMVKIIVDSSVAVGLAEDIRAAGTSPTIKEV